MFSSIHKQLIMPTSSQPDRSNEKYSRFPSNQMRYIIYTNPSQQEVIHEAFLVRIVSVYLLYPRG